MATEPGPGGRIVMFGGRDRNNYFSDTWTWDGAKWKLHFVPGGSPEVRHDGLMAGDGATGTVVLFGGERTTTPQGIGTWVWDGTDPTSPTWTKVITPVEPPNGGRSGSMAYDAISRKVILVERSSLEPTTWTWDGTARTWALEQSAPDGLGQMAYDAKRGKVVLFTDSNQTNSGQTWIWDGSLRSWMQASPSTSPSPRWGYQLAFDAKRERVVMFGGTTASGLSDETWTWDGSNWTLQSPLARPSARVNHAMAYHAGTKRVMMFGGYDGGSLHFNDTWTYTKDWMHGFVVSEASVAEGDAGPTTLDFTVELQGTSPTEVAVSYATADGTATAGSDYTPTSGRLVFAPGERTKTVSVPVVADTVHENDESLTLALSAATGAPIATKSATGTIVNDDAKPSVSIADVSATEGDSGTKVFAFTVSLSNPSVLATTVSFATADGTASAPKDYVAKTGTLTIPAGATTGKVKVAVNANLVVEPDETFVVNLSNPTNATLADAQATGTILNDD